MHAGMLLFIRSRVQWIFDFEILLSAWHLYTHENIRTCASWSWQITNDDVTFC